MPTPAREHMVVAVSDSNQTAIFSHHCSFLSGRAAHTRIHFERGAMRNPERVSHFNRCGTVPDLHRIPAS